MAILVQKLIHCNRSKEKKIYFYVIAVAFNQTGCSLHKVKDWVSEVIFAPSVIRLPIYHWGVMWLIPAQLEWEMEQGRCFASSVKGGFIRMC